MKLWKAKGILQIPRKARKEHPRRELATPRKGRPRRAPGQFQKEPGLFQKGRRRKEPDRRQKEQVKAQKAARRRQGKRQRAAHPRKERNKAQKAARRRQGKKRRRAGLPGSLAIILRMTRNILQRESQTPCRRAAAPRKKNSCFGWYFSNTCQGKPFQP